MKTRMILTIPVPVPNDMFMALCDYMEEVHCKRDIAVVTGEAIKMWIARAHARAAEAPSSQPQGYQWKNLFLPAGTRLRTRVQGRTFHATVEGDRLKHEGRDISPHGFANAFGVSGRNAWRDVWIHLPYDQTWKLAAVLRKDLIAA